MKQKTVYKLIIDAAMTLLYILLMIDFGGGTFFHETAGLLIGLLFAAHVVLNRRGFAALWRGLIHKGGWKSGLKLTLDVLLPLVMLLDIGTGVLMARSLFTLKLSYDWAVVSTIHTAASWAGLAILAAHIALHLRYLLAVSRVCLTDRKSAAVLGVLRRAGAVALALAVVYAATYAVYARAGTGAAAMTASAASGEQAEAAEEENAAEEFASGDTDALPPEGGHHSKKRGEGKGSHTSQAKTSDSSDDDDSDTQSGATISGGVPPTLDEFLSAMTCTGCGKHCLLISPHCGKGEAQQQEAAEEYEAAYGES